MENLEWLSGQPLLLDERRPSLIGPVINSKRQLWSVGAYLGMVIHDVFGLSAAGNGIEIKPFVTAKLRREIFARSNQVALDNLHLHGKRIAIRLHLPPAVKRDGHYAVERVLLNGAGARQAIAWDQLAFDNLIEVRLGALAPGQQAIRRVRANPYDEASTVFGPHEPSIASLERDSKGHTHVRIEPGGNGSKVRYNVYRDGKQVAAARKAGTWTDRSGSAAACYAVEAQFEESGNRSHHSIPRCTGFAIEIGAGDPRVVSNPAFTGPVPHVPGWGKPEDRFTVNRIEVTQAGAYAVQIRYHNGANHVNLGISAGVKWLAMKNADGAVVAQGVVQLPHSGAATPTVYSTPLAAQLSPGIYSLELSDFYNMSYLRSNSTFSDAGGIEGPANRFDLYGVRLLRAR
jgi:hypothetical protein